MQELLKEVVILIPALNPNEGLIALVEDLKKENLNNIIVINDGSISECNNIFSKLTKKYDIKVYNHEVNLGKGQAIKTGISKIKNDNIIGVVTVDADGQHLAKDARKVAEKLGLAKIILGERYLEGKNVPLPSKIGNKFSSIYLNLLTGAKLTDTQTGLRGIPKKYFELALNVNGQRYEYEMNFLKEVYKNKIEVETIPIETIYENRIKNFRILKDSYIIYKDFLKNIISSLISAIIDVILFQLFVCSGVYVFYSNIFARIISGISDFSINKKWVFRNNKNSNNRVVELSKYTILFMIQMLINSILVTVLNQYYSNIILIIKIIINFLMYIVNYFIKKKFIFK